jgi:hypothetical protein
LRRQKCAPHWLLLAADKVHRERMMLDSAGLATALAAIQTPVDYLDFEVRTACTFVMRDE